MIICKRWAWLIKLGKVSWPCLAKASMLYYFSESGRSGFLRVQADVHESLSIFMSRSTSEASTRWNLLTGLTAVLSAYKGQPLLKSRRNELLQHKCLEWNVTITADCIYVFLMYPFYWRLASGLNRDICNGFRCMFSLPSCHTEVAILVLSVSNVRHLGRLWPLTQTVKWL